MGLALGVWAKEESGHWSLVGLSTPPVSLVEAVMRQVHLCGLMKC